MDAQLDLGRDARRLRLSPSSAGSGVGLRVSCGDLRTSPHPTGAELSPLHWGGCLGAVWVTQIWELLVHGRFRGGWIKGAMADGQRGKGSREPWAVP